MTPCLRQYNDFCLMIPMQCTRIHESVLMKPIKPVGLFKSMILKLMNDGPLQEKPKLCYIKIDTYLKLIIM